jgi:hypothetical protein
VLRAGTRIARAKTRNGSARQSNVIEASEQHTGLYTCILFYIEHYAPVTGWKCGIFVMKYHVVAWMVLRFIARLARKHVRQNERDHPGYDVKAQEYF